MKVISVINYKGGVGKTTLTANLGAELALRGKNILLIDLDPQASLTFSFIKPEEWEKDLSEYKTIRNWFEIFPRKTKPPFKNLIYLPTKLNDNLKLKARLELIPSHLELINTEIELASELGAKTLCQGKKDYLNMHSRLVKGIMEFDTAQYDYVLLDCPPNFNIITKNAIVASDFVLIPAKADYLSTLGILHLKQSLEGFVRDYNKFVKFNQELNLVRIVPEVLGVVFTMVQYYREEPISTAKKYIKDIKDENLTVFENTIRANNSLFGDAPDLQCPVVLKKPASQIERKAIDNMKLFVNEFENKIKQKPDDEN